MLSEAIQRAERVHQENPSSTTLVELGKLYARAGRVLTWEEAYRLSREDMGVLPPEVFPMVEWHRDAYYIQRPRGNASRKFRVHPIEKNRCTAKELYHTLRAHLEVAGFKAWTSAKGNLWIRKIRRIIGAHEVTWIRNTRAWGKFHYGGVHYQHEEWVSIRTWEARELLLEKWLGLCPTRGP